MSLSSDYVCIAVRCTGFQNSIDMDCYEAYTFTNEDIASFGPDVIHDPRTYPNYATVGAWSYSNDHVLDTADHSALFATYRGGGFVHQLQLNENISLGDVLELKVNKWIDHNTRAVFLEFTTYNPNKHLFVYTNLLAEFAGTGGVVASPSVEVLKPNVEGTSIASYYGVCRLVLLVYMIVYIGEMIRGICSQKYEYLYKACNWLNIFIVISMLLFGACYTRKQESMVNIMAEIHRDSTEYTHFSRVAFDEILYKCSIAFLNFLVILKIIFYLRLNKRLSHIIANVQFSGHAIGVIMSYFVPIWIGFSGLMYLFLVLDGFSFRSFSASLWALIALPTRNLSIDSELFYYRYSTTILFSMYTLFANFIMFSMVIVLLTHVHYEVYANRYQFNQDYRILDILLEMTWPERNIGLKELRKRRKEKVKIVRDIENQKGALIEDNHEYAVKNNHDYAVEDKHDYVVEDNHDYAVEDNHDYVVEDNHDYVV